MALLHGPAGKWCEEQAILRSRKIASHIGVLCIPAMMLCGFICGLAWGSPYAYLGAAGMCVVGLIFLRAIRRRSPLIGALSQERLHMLRGAEGEMAVGLALQELDDDWHIFNNIQLERQSDLDHIVVGPGGVFCISTKSHRGWYVVTADGMTHNGKPCSFAREAMGQTMQLKGRLEAMMGSGVPWITSIVALPFGQIDNPICGKVWLCNADDLVRRIAPVNGPKPMSKAQVERVVKVMEMIQNSAAAVYERAA